MKVTIEEINTDNIQHLNTCNGEFTIDSKLILDIQDGRIVYTVTALPARKKRYNVDDIDGQTYLTDPDRTAFLAYVEDRIAGQIILRKNWNRYAYVEDIVVDANYRREGIGSTLVSKAEDWGRERELPGVMLETQNTNVRACTFYQCCGFQLGGFDTYLYRGLKPDTDEVALYWYLIFEDEQPDAIPVP
jgi:ribosomal protein S18 acetylase RimI-like enzyme